MVDPSGKTSPAAAGNVSEPVVCLGMPLYNQTFHLPEAIESLLAQSYRNFKLIVCDDSTIPSPGNIVKSYAAADQRIRYHRNESRKGMVENWRTCFDQAGNPDYFAWVADHDVWHVKWLEALVHVLETRKTVQLVYPVTVNIDENGGLLNKKNKSGFSSLGMDDAERVKTFCRHAKGFGDMVYGLFRAEALQRAGVFRRVLWPDVILLLELSLQGDIHQLDARLWYRRKTAVFRIGRQKKSLFVRKPWYIFLPWPIVNGIALFWYTVFHAENHGWQRRKLGLQLMFRYLQRWSRKFGQDSWIGSYQQWRSGKAPWMKKLNIG
jgi:glycosyltransferase involved in cell wall biosynthesis